MTSFGEGLKREREKKQITLDQVSVSTKISVRMLRAIEEEKFEQLPGGIFNKGFVRAYARHLGLDEDQAVADYLAAAAPPTVPGDDLELRAMAEQKERERQRQARLTRQFPWGWVAIALLLVAFGFSLWGVFSAREVQSGKAVSAESPPRPQLSPPPQADTEAKAQDTSPHPSSAMVPRAVAPVKPPSSPPGRVVDGSFTVLVTAQDDSWLSITADGKMIFTGTLIAPGVQLVRAKDSIVIRAGNLGGLDFEFNGKHLPAQGDYGEAETLTFDSSGLKPQPKQDE